MKQITLPTGFNKFVASVLDTLAQEDQSPSKVGAKRSNAKRYRPERKEFFYYLQIIDVDTKNVVGHLADISSGGFKLDSQIPVEVNKDFQFRINLTAEVANKPFIVFGARSKWCQVDPIDPYTYNIGYQLVHIASQDLEIFSRLMEKYGKDYSKRNHSSQRSNKW